MKKRKKSRKALNPINSKKVTILVFVLLLISAYFTATSLLQPKNISSTKLDNLIQHDTLFSYQANVEQSSLYPNGGLIEADSIIFEKVTKELHVNILSTINSNVPIQGEGTFQPSLTIEAGDLWTKEIPLSEEQSFVFEGTENTAIDETLIVNLKEVTNLINSIEEEMGVSPNQYFFKLNPGLNGKLNFKDEEIAISGEEELVFEYGYNKITQISEGSFLQETPIESNVIVTNNYSLFGITIPLLVAQLISTAITICLLLFLVWQIRSLSRSKRSVMKTNAEEIDQKYRNRLITVSKKMDIVNKSFLVLDSMSALVQVADEKELPIFRYEDTTKEVIVYFSVDIDYIYSFEARNKKENENSISAGSEVSYG